MNELVSASTAVVSLLKSVPDVVWSGIVGSLITVVGVRATNLGLSRRHTEQLAHTAEENARKRAHDASESALERKMKLRRDVFIPAIEAVFIATSALAALADPNTPASVTQRKFVDSVGVISKVNAIASAEAVAAASALLNCLMMMNVGLSFKRGSIDAAFSLVQANAQVVSRSVEEHGRWVQTQTSLLYEGPPPEERWKFVNGQIAFHQAQIDQWKKKHQESLRNLQLAQLEFFKALADSHTQMSDASILASIALRGELDMLNDDREGLRKLLKEQSVIAKGTLQEAIIRLEVLLGMRE